MRKLIWLSVLTVCLWPASFAQAFVTVDVFKDAYIDDFDFAPVYDGDPDFITNSQALFVGNGILNDGNALEARGVMTFDIGIFGGQTLEYAKLIGIGGRAAGQTIDVFLAAGNGLVELSDFNVSADNLGPMPLEEIASFLDTKPFEMDVTSALQTLLLNGDDYAEFRISSNFMDPFKDAIILAGEADPKYSIPEGQVGPQLILSFREAKVVPEPASLFLFGSGVAGLFFRRKR